MGWDNGGGPVAVGSLQVLPGAPGVDTSAAGILAFGLTNATGYQFEDSIALDTDIAGILLLGGPNATSIKSAPDFNFASHLLSTSAGTPATSALGVNVTSATFTGNDTRGTITIVMSAGLAANARICTATFAVSYGATSPKVTLVDQTSGVGLAIFNSYVLAQATGVSFDIAFDQGLGAGTYTIDYIVIG